MKRSSSILVNKDNIDSIAIGGFDGMHIAHQQLFNNLTKDGAIISIETGYATLTPKNYRQEYTPFPIFYYDLKNIKELNGVEFIKLLKNDFKNLKKIIVGFDFCFGKDRTCTVNDLKKVFDGEVVIVSEIKLDNFPVHSRYIREFLLNGDIEKANNFLGKEYKIYGKHIVGQGIGKKEFVATINLNVAEFLLPQSGVYITKTVVNNYEYNSISFLGHRETTDGNFAVESHILNIDDLEVKDEIIQIKFIKQIRQNKKFSSFLELKNQILEDINIAKKYFY
ncbi:bifunctional riboflavin kinase/FAD synthetase [Aliarcobacter lanthieri]|uniref:bifunctional riboflavin kinase/FAD synthetase n=1 Tax=Aliarcobacter lanthieri TaxID=1355374 RepID=UPI000479BA4B|nr:bifunctional riboflavin kinase/FAD synthetase [Aliarcobacter lanthieri]QKF59875.1 bifunctional riboflavin kinase / FMN adenylyltransferase [Aliarcobacter lanthieri]